MDLKELYQDIILEHGKNPRNFGRCSGYSHKAKGHNPLCGDELEITLTLSDEIIQDCRTIVRGCSICQASASIMSDMIIKKTIKEAIKTSRMFDESLKKDDENVPKTVEPLRPFLALKVHRSRIKCMKLVWDALEECTNNDKSTNHT